MQTTKKSLLNFSNVDLLRPKQSSTTNQNQIDKTTTKKTAKIKRYKIKTKQPKTNAKRKRKQKGQGQERNERKGSKRNRRKPKEETGNDKSQCKAAHLSQDIVPPKIQSKNMVGFDLNQAHKTRTNKTRTGERLILWRVFPTSLRVPIFKVLKGFGLKNFASSL